MHLGTKEYEKVEQHISADETKYVYKRKNMRNKILITRGTNYDYVGTKIRENIRKHKEIN
jgi:hypothetical protein